jgi:DNA-binding response OmpR family regulator
MSKKILMVDDTAIYRTQMQLFLSLYKFQVFLAVDGLDALKKMENETFDLVISDVEMPNMNGFELLASIKRKNASMPVIMLTTLDKDVHIEKAKKLGADFYIVKPFTKEKIEEALKSIGFSI